MISCLRATCEEPRAEKSNYCREHQFDDSYCESCHASPHEPGCGILELINEVKQARIRAFEECRAQRPHVYTNEIGHRLSKAVTEFFDVWLPQRIMEERPKEEL